MITVKIECPCGQHYAFDVEPVNGRMPSPVACPACGADGSAAANEFIAQHFAQPVALPASSPASAAPRLAAHPPPAGPPSRRGAPLPGQPDRNQVMFEAHAKISWGDSPKEVLKYLMVNGFSYEDASAFVNESFNERTAAIRASGIRYIFIGSLVAFVPIGFWIICMKTGVIYPRTLIITIAVGLAGIGMLIKGGFMVVSPKSSSGDVADQ